MYEDITSPKSFVYQRWEKSWLACQPEEGNPNNGYAGAVKTDATGTVKVKCNNDLSSFQLHFIINFILTEPKLAHSLVKFPASLISHFVLSIIVDKTGSTAKLNSAKLHIYGNPPKYIPAKISGHTVPGPSSTVTYA